MHRILPVLAALIYLASCQKQDSMALSSAADITSFGLDGKKALVNIATPKRTINIRLDDTIFDASNVTASFSLSSGASAAINNVSQVSGQTSNDFETDLNYTVTAADHMTKEQWTVHTTNNDYAVPWGMGNFVKRNKSNDNAYEWYIDQSTTGTDALLNCGPTSVTMAIKWADASFTKTPQDARAKYPEGDGWWFTYDIDNYLTDNTIPHAIIPLAADAEKTRDLLAKQIDSGHIVILCIDMNYVSAAAADAFHVDKFYSTSPGWGHFFVIKGYKQVDQTFYFDIYDPYSFSRTNTDGSLKGKDRFYRYADVFNASSNWWDFAFVVGKKGQVLDVTTTRQAVNPAFIPHRHGM